MADRRERVPKNARTELDDLGDQRQVESSSRGGWRWWWVWPVIIALVLWWAGWGWGSTGGWWWGRSHSQNTAISAPPGARTTETPANAGAQQPLTSNGAAPQNSSATGAGVQVLAAENKAQFIGQPFQVSDVPVQQKVNDRVMWIGSSTVKPMLAVLSSNSGDKNVNAGSVVNATGSVEKAPPAAQAERQWSISAQDAQRMENEGAYIQVSQLTVPQH
jgi:hypothetical protein